MGAYNYQALSKKGRTCTGVIEANSPHHARALLRQQNLLPTTVNSVKKDNKVNNKEKISLQELCVLTRQLASMLAAGIPIDEALSCVADQSDNQKTRQLMTGVRAKVMEGYDLAHAMAEYPLAFPELYRATIHAGEHTGRLDLVLEKLADYTHIQQQTRQKIQHALIYPAVMLTVSLSIIGFLLAFVVPKIIEVFQTSGQTLPVMTNVLIAMSSWIQKYGLVTLCLILICTAIAHRSAKREHVLGYYHQIMLKLPVIKYLIVTINASRYIHTFSILFAAGGSVLETMRVSASLVTNLQMRAAFDEAAIQVKQGLSISQALHATNYLGSMATHLIASGEKSGQISEMMERTAEQLDDVVRGRIDTALTLLEPMIILFMGAVVLFIVLATLLPIFSMEQMI